MGVIVPEVLILVAVAHQWENHIMDQRLKQERQMAYLPNYMASYEHSQVVSATSPLLNKYCVIWVV